MVGFMGQNRDVLDGMGSVHPKLVRGRVWCRSCGATTRVNTAEAFRHGWPKCCGYTMTIDAPNERTPPAEETK